jgi:uncharacterized cupin superfamily protein
MTKIFKATERRFEVRPGSKEGFSLASDAAITAGMASARGTETDDAGAPDILGRGSLNFDIRRLDPGEFSSLYHFHRHAEELFMITGGEATLRTPDGLHILQQGDVAFFGTGSEGAHQLYNHSDAPCVYLDVRTFAGIDIADYPDSGRFLVLPAMELFDKSASMGYFDGEPSADGLREIFSRQQ